MSLEAIWAGPLSPVDSVRRLRCSGEVRGRRRQPEAGWPRAVRLAGSVARMWRRRADAPASTSAQTKSELLQRAPLSQPCTADELDIAVRYRAAEPEAQLGGDWYDAFVDASGATFLTVGDVSGHDHKASAAMSQILTWLRGPAFDADDGPARLLGRLDAAMARLQVTTLATAVVARVEPSSAHGPGSSQRVNWSSAGHVPPLLRDPDGAVTRLEVEPDLLLGISPDTPRFDHAIDLKVGATLLLYTDGLIERRDEDLDEGIDNLATTLSNAGDLDPDRLCEAIIESTAAFEAGDDDIALLVLRATG